MALSNPNPSVIPPVEAKTFPDLWISNISIHAPTLTDGRICIEALPYNQATSDLGSGQDVMTICTDDLWRAVGEVPEVEAAMNAIFAAVEPLRLWQAAQDVLAEVES